MILEAQIPKSSRLVVIPTPDAWIRAYSIRARDRDTLYSFSV